jgi:hypothetical protein
MKKMNLKLAFVAAMALMVSTANAQTQSVKGNNYVNAGIGIGTFGFNGTGGLPVTIGYDRGITDQISVGAYLGMVRTKYAYDYKYKYTIFGIRGSYHFNELLEIENPQIDVYGGVAINYRNYTLKYDWEGHNEKVSGSTVGVGIHAGGRYFFTDKFGAYAELGYGISPLQLGAVLKF